MSLTENYCVPRQSFGEIGLARVVFGVLYGLSCSKHDYATLESLMPVYCVSPDGLNTNVGSELKPWKTFNYALNKLRPGDILLARGGEYPEIVKPSTTKGLASARITVKRYNSERPVIRGLLGLNSPDYWTIDGIGGTWLNGQSSKSHMWKITNGVGWEILNCELWGAHSYANLLVAGTLTGFPNNWLVSKCMLHDVYKSNDTNQDHAIYCNTGKGSGKGLIQNCIIWNVANGNGVKVAGASAGTGSKDVIVRYNTIYNCTQGILVGWETNNALIERNIIVKVASNYGAIRGFEITGTNNIAKDNLWNLAKTCVLNYDAGNGVKDAGGNTRMDPRFVSAVPPYDFHVLEPHAYGYGAYAI